ncbi:hypothetical protein ONZ45_g19695 [Pleurotus djamor]|nr:hypothetical protein ONZ45_g19695 [Pleurotus djamor]
MDATSLSHQEDQPECAIRACAFMIESSRAVVNPTFRPYTRALFKPFTFLADPPRKSIGIDDVSDAHEEGANELTFAVNEAFYRVHRRDDFAGKNNWHPRYSAISHAFKTTYIRSLLASSIPVLTISESHALMTHLSHLDTKRRYEVIQDAHANALTAFLGFHGRVSSEALHFWLLDIVSPLVKFIYEDKLEIKLPVKEEPLDFHRLHNPPVPLQATPLSMDGHANPFEGPQFSYIPRLAPAGGISNVYIEARRAFHSSWQHLAPPNPPHMDTSVQPPKRPLTDSAELFSLPHLPRKKPRLDENSPTIRLPEDMRSLPSRDALTSPKRRTWKSIRRTLAQTISSPPKPSSPPDLVSEVLPQDCDTSTPPTHEPEGVVSPRSSAWNNLRRILARRFPPRTSPPLITLRSPSPIIAGEVPGTRLLPTESEGGVPALLELTSQFSISGLLERGKAKFSSSTTSSRTQGLGLILPSSSSPSRSVAPASTGIPHVATTNHLSQDGRPPSVSRQPPSTTTMKRSRSKSDIAGGHASSMNARGLIPMLKKHKSSIEHPN